MSRAPPADTTDRVVFNRAIPTVAMDTEDGQERCRGSVDFITDLRAETLIQGLHDFQQHMFVGRMR